MDRLRDLTAAHEKFERKDTEWGFSPQENDRQPQVCFLEPPSEEDLDTATSLSAFFQRSYNNIYLIVIAIRSATRDLSRMHEENIANVDEERAKELREKITDYSEQMSKFLADAKEELEHISESVTEMKKDQQTIEENAAVVRIQENLYFYLSRLLREAMMQYDEMQGRNKEKYKEKTKRQILIKDPTMTEERAQLLTEQLGTTAESEIFKQSKHILASITETRNDIYRIEQSMRDLQQMFNEMAILVNEQGEMIDVILTNLQSTSKYLAKGRRELKRARSYQKKSRKKLYCLVGCGAFLFLLVVVVVMGFMIPK